MLPRLRRALEPAFQTLLAQARVRWPWVKILQSVILVAVHFTEGSDEGEGIMPNETAAWLAALITLHHDNLVQTLAANTQADIPFYRARDLAQVQQGFAAYFAALRDVLHADDIAPLRVYLHGLLAARMRQGADGGVYIQLLDRAEAAVQQIIRDTTDSDPARAAEALRLIGSIARNSRLIVSEANLYNVVHGNSPPRRRVEGEGEPHQ